MGHEIEGRTVEDVVDGSGLYFSRMVTAGPLAFLGGVATDSSGVLAGAAEARPPYHVSPDAHIAAQTRYLFDRYKQLLTGVGSALNNMLQVEQYIPRKVYADGYVTTSRADGFMDRARPASALICTGDLLPPESIISPMGIAVIPGTSVVKHIEPPTDGYHDSLSQYGDNYRTEGPFNEVLTAGPYVFVVGDVAFDFETHKIEPDVMVSGDIWWGSAIRNELNFLLSRLETYLARAGSTMSDVLHSSVYLANIEDLYEFDQVWALRFGPNLPARTLFPVRGLSVPACEGVNMTHRDGALRMEMMVVALRPGYQAEKQIVSTGARQHLCEQEAIKAGQLMWISAQYPVDDDANLMAAATAGQVDHLFSRLAKICEAGGSSLSNLVRLRAFVIDPDDGYVVYGALKRAVPENPPTVMITTVPAPLPFPGCKVMIDAIAYVPNA